MLAYSFLILAMPLSLSSSLTAGGTSGTAVFAITSAIVNGVCGYPLPAFRTLGPTFVSYVTMTHVLRLEPGFRVNCQRTIRLPNPPLYTPHSSIFYTLYHTIHHGL